MTGSYCCVFCLDGNKMELRHDKHDRPYLFCRACSARVFPRLGMFSIYLYEYVSLLAQHNKEDLRKMAAGRMGSQAESVRQAEKAGKERIQEIIAKGVTKHE